MNGNLNWLIKFTVVSYYGSNWAITLTVVSIWVSEKVISLNRSCFNECLYIYIYIYIYMAGIIYPAVGSRTGAQRYKSCLGGR